MERKKSAKDMAFDKERAKYRHEIRNLTQKIQTQMEEVSVLNKRISELEECVRQKDDWIQRLLEYTELSEEDMKKRVRQDKMAKEVVDELEKMNILISGFSKRFGL